MTPARRLLARPDYWRLAGVGQLSALPNGMTSLAYTLLTASILGSNRVGSLLVSAGVIAQAIAGPAVGRVLDRVGTGRGLRGLLVLAASGYGLLAVLAGHVPEPVLVLLAVLPAIPNAAVTGGVLSAMSQTLPDDLLSSAIAMNDTLLEGTLIAGPLLAAALALIAPTAAIGAMAVALVLAALLLPGLGGRPDLTKAPGTSLLGERRLRPWLWAAVATGALYGSLEVGALGLAHRLHGGSGAAALLLTVISGSSAVAGIAYTGLGHRVRWSASRLTAVLLFLPACGLAVVAASHSWLITGPVLAGLGLCTAPLMTTQSVGARAAFPDGRHAEGFTLLATAGSAGYALGSLCVAVLPLTAAQLTGAAGTLAIALALGVSDRRIRKADMYGLGRIWSVLDGASLPREAVVQCPGVVDLAPERDPLPRTCGVTIDTRPRGCLRDTLPHANGWIETAAFTTFRMRSKRSARVSPARRNTECG